MYQETRVISVLQALSATLFISSFGILQQSLLERSLSFNSLAKLELASVIFGALVGVGLALVDAGVWSLVFQSLATVSLSTILLWSSSSWRPRLELHWTEVKSVSRFGLNLAGFNIFNYFTRNADYLLIGRYLGAQDLGYYTLAYRVLLVPLQNISTVIGRVLYPVLSSAREDKVRFTGIYLKVIRNIAIVTFPLMLGLLALAEPLVQTFFGEAWQPVVLLIVIFAPVGLIQSIATTVGSIYQAMGKTDWMLRWGISSGILAIFAFVIGIRWGIAGVGISYAIVSFILAYPGFSIPFRLINLTVPKMLKQIFPSFLNGGIMFAVVLLLQGTLLASLPVGAGLVYSTVAGVLVYGLSSWMTNRAQILELWNLAGFRERKSYDAG
jgi:PST family polysaccharide transporter